LKIKGNNYLLCWDLSEAGHLRFTSSPHNKRNHWPYLLRVSQQACGALRGPVDWTNRNKQLCLKTVWKYRPTGARRRCTPVAAAIFA